MIRPKVRESTTRTPPPRAEPSSIALRLAIGKDGLGIELAKKAPVGPLDVVELTVRLPHVRFPFDVSGGVAKFRHKRGELERLAVEIDARRGARWAEAKLAGLLDAGTCTVNVVPRAFAATLTVRAGRRALAFEIAAVPARDEIALVVHAARGAHLVEPPTALAIRATAALLSAVPGLVREGARFVVARSGEGVARALLPDAGVRAPNGDDVRLSGCGESDGVLFAIFTRGGTIAQVPDEVTLANETARLTREGDDARVAGEWERARAMDLQALERAPRHPEIARRIAELDAHAGGRAEAALTTLREAKSSLLGLLGGALMVEAGDPRSAIAALMREGERETSNVLAALAYEEAARLVGEADPDEALRDLDLAVARAPRLAELRWRRAERRLVQGRLADARADFQELEALAQGSVARHEVLRRAGDVYRAAGLGADAALHYERALLYRPDDPDAIAGLGAAIAAEGRAARGASLLQHALALVARKNESAPWMELELAKVLADRMNDKPAAVARLRAIADDAREAITARGLEGRYRAAIGDLAGAALAYARLRERAGNERESIPWLLEAASFEEQRNDLAAAQRHLVTATSIAPADATVAERLRAVGERLAKDAGVKKIVIEEAPPAPVMDEGAAEERVEQLTRTLQGDPTNDRVVDELVVLLTKLGRTMELLALLSARLEDAPPDRRAELLPHHLGVLAKLEEEARADGRDAEADLFKMAREASN